MSCICTHFVFFSFCFAVIVEEWQRRQRAEKERERQQKQASAEYLSGYRASQLSEEEVKLQAIKEEERRKKAEAAERLRNFKKLEEPNAINKSPVKTTQGVFVPPPANVGQQTQEDIAFGSVSAMKANLEDSFSHPTTSTTSPIKNAPKTTQAAAAAAAAMPTMEPLDSAAAVPTEPSNGGMVNSEMPAAAPAAQVQTLLEDPFAKSPQAATPYNFAAAPTVETIPSPPANVVPPPVAETLPQPPQPFTVYFKFGLITDGSSSPSSSPDDVKVLDSYTQAIRTILNDTTTGSNGNVGTLQSVTILETARDTSFQDDHGRPDVYRLLVTVAVVWQPAAEHEDDPAAIRTIVWNAVGHAIQSGQLLEQSRLYKSIKK